MKGGHSVWVHESARAERLSRLRIASLEKGRVDSVFHYQSSHQADLWMAVHRAHAPVFGNEAFRSIYLKAAEATSREVAGRRVRVVGYGVGGGWKERALLEALIGAGCRVRYTPVDSSLELALHSAEVASDLGLEEVSPVIADLRGLPDADEWLGGREAGEVRIFTAYGVAPNLLPDDFCGIVARALRSSCGTGASGGEGSCGDRLLLSANLLCGGADKEAVLAQYDNPETRRWIRQVLADWGWESLLGETQFSIEEIEGVPAVSASCGWLARAEKEVCGVRRVFAEGERVGLFFSTRYTPELLGERLGRGGLSSGGAWVTPCAQEGVWSVALTER